MPFTITFMRVTLRARKSDVVHALTPPTKPTVIEHAVAGHANPIKTITGAGLSYLGTGRWRLSGNYAEVQQALHLLTRASQA